MSQHTQLQAADGDKFDAYIAQPTGEPKAGIVVLQEIFGVKRTDALRRRRLCRRRILTIALALFDRAQRDVELAYGPDEGKQGMQIVQRIPVDQTLADIAAAIQYLREHGAHKVGVVGYCWGGTMAWLSNTRLHPDATVSYYPGGIQNYIQEKSTCPAIFHFGQQDNHIPQSVVDQVRHEYPGFSVFTYEGAGHAFSNDARPSYNPTAAKLAQQRTLAHFDEYLVATH